jgi:hypothetical protein
LRVNNRAENSHQPLRRRERKAQGFTRQSVTSATLGAMKNQRTSPSAPSLRGLVLTSSCFRRSNVSFPVGILNGIDLYSHSKSVPRHGAGIGCSAVEGARITGRHRFIVIALKFVDQGHPIDPKPSAVVDFLNGSRDFCYNRFCDDQRADLCVRRRVIPPSLSPFCPAERPGFFCMMALLAMSQSGDR